MQKLGEVENLFLENLYAFIDILPNATSTDISKRLMNRKKGMVALCRAIPICGYYDRRNLLQDLFPSRIAVYVHR